MAPPTLILVPPSEGKAPGGDGPPWAGGTMALAGADSVSDSIPGTLAENTLASPPSSAKTMRLWATGHCRLRASASNSRVLAIAAGMLPPPNTAGSAKPFTKSTMSSA